MKFTIKKDKKSTITISNISLKKLKSGLIEFQASSTDGRFKSECKLYVNKQRVALQTDTTMAVLTPGGETKDQIQEEYRKYRIELCEKFSKWMHLIHKEEDRWLSKNTDKFFAKESAHNIAEWALIRATGIARVVSSIKYKFKKLCKIS